jgi:hypothetical protein
MKCLLRILLSKKSPKAATRTDRRACLRLENLEDRLVPAVITDMTQLAQMFGRHTGPTTIFVNFDGSAADGVSAFQTVSGDRNRDIHEILFRTQEIFAPFDVIVRRITGNGARDTGSAGSTTVFVGDGSGNGTGTSNKAYAGTDLNFCDYPGQVKGITHQPNSDPFDVSYVDPVYASGGTTASWGVVGIAQAIAHEAGHTFGLDHVLSSPDPEIMSYDATNVRFVNKTFNLTDLNYNGTTTTHDPDHTPEWYTHYDLGVFGLGFNIPVRMTTQNSYTYLKAALGSRVTAGDFANVADPSAVDHSYVDGTSFTLGVGGSTTGTIGRLGDWDVLSLKANTTGWVQVGVTRTGTSALDPVVLVYDATGKNEVTFNDDRGSGDRNSRVYLYATAGQTFKIVIGSYGADSTGSYQVSASSYHPTLTYAPPTLSPGQPPTQVLPTSAVLSHMSTALVAGLARQGSGSAGSASGLGEAIREVALGRHQGPRSDGLADQLFAGDYRG